MEATAKTSVWWNMDACKIPEWCDAGRIRDCIKGALEKLGYSGPDTISAYGNLNKIPGHVLRGLSSTGITVHHHPRTFMNFTCDVSAWKLGTKPPATMMIIAGISELDIMFKPFSAVPTSREFKFVLVSGIGPYAAYGSPMLHRQAKGIYWMDILEDARISHDKQESRRGKFLLQKCSETSESALLVCSSCKFSSQSFESFTTHLSSEEHLHIDYSYENKVVQASRDFKTDPKTLVDANNFKKNLRKRKRNKEKKLEKKLMMIAEYVG